jgi:hypothetical protein
VQPHQKALPKAYVRLRLIAKCCRAHSMGRSSSALLNAISIVIAPPDSIVLKVSFCVGRTWSPTATVSAIAVIHTDRHTVFVCICSLYVPFSSGCDGGSVKFPQWHENQPSISPPLKATKDTILVRLAVSFVSLSTRIRT